MTLNSMQNVFKNRYIDKLCKKQPVFIAEIGLNHNGNIEEAIALIEKAAQSGADMVKFQIFNPEKFYSVYTKSLLRNEQPVFNDEIIQFFKRFELCLDDYAKIQEAACRHGVVFFASCFDEDSFNMLESLNVPLYKIASSEITNIPLLKRIAATHKPVIVSTGISYEHEIAHAVNILQGGGCDVVLLHCVSLYPVEDKMINIQRITSLQQKFGLPVGFSDHSKDSLAAMLAAALGARVFEKHFKLSADHDCVDKGVSLTPDEFIQYIYAINRACIMLGDGSIDFSHHEAEVARSARRSIYAAKDILAGTIIRNELIAIKRPGVGLSPLKIDKIVGKKAKRNIMKDMPITEDDVE